MYLALIFFKNLRETALSGNLVKDSHPFKKSEKLLDSQIFVCIKEQKLCTLLSSFKKFERNCFIW